MVLRRDSQWGLPHARFHHVVLRHVMPPHLYTADVTRTDCGPASLLSPVAVHPVVTLLAAYDFQNTSSSHFNPVVFYNRTFYNFSYQQPSPLFRVARPINLVGQAWRCTAFLCH